MMVCGEYQRAPEDTLRFVELTGMRPWGSYWDDDLTYSSLVAPESSAPLPAQTRSAWNAHLRVGPRTCSSAGNAWRQSQAPTNPPCIASVCQTDSSAQIHPR